MILNHYCRLYQNKRNLIHVLNNMILSLTNQRILCIDDPIACDINRLISNVIDNVLNMLSAVHALDYLLSLYILPQLGEGVLISAFAEFDREILSIYQWLKYNPFYD